MPTSTLTSKGQLTMPKEVRERLGVSQGDRLSFRFDHEGRLILEPVGRPPMQRLFGILEHRAHARPVTLEEMDKAIGRHLAKKHEAIRTKGAWNPYEDED